MEDVHIILKELKDYRCIKDYFNNKDIVSLGEIMDAFEYELEIEEKRNTIEDVSESEEDNYDDYILRKKGLI